MIGYLLAAVIASATNAPGQTNHYDLTASQLNQLAEAHAFVIGQESSLALIQRDFPELTGEVSKVSLAFEASAFGEGHRGVQSALSNRFGGEWSKFDVNVTEQIRTSIGQQAISRDDAIQFLTEVKARANGELPDAIRATLLSFNPEYSENPAREFLDGWKRVFESKGHLKAKGANFSIAYPSSWVAAEGERPNILQKFRGGGYGIQMATIVTKNLPVESGTVLTEQDQLEMLSFDVLRGSVPPNATLIDVQTTRIDGSPAGIIEYTMTAERVGMTYFMHTWAINFLCENTLVQVQFSLGGQPGSETDIARRMEAFKPLFTLMASSVVLPDKWTVPTETAFSFTPEPRPTTSTLPPDIPSPSILAIAFVFTWVVGLAPPLVVRYVIARRSLSKTMASWIAGGTCALFWMAEQVAFNDGEQAGKVTAVWIIMFCVSRWIMSRGYIESPSDGVSADASNTATSWQSKECHA